MEKHPCADFHYVNESQPSVQSHLLQPKPTKLHSDSESWGCRQIQKVPSQMRRRVQRSEPVYDPTMVSIGPYHHGKPELRRAEDFKHLCLDQLAGGQEKKKAFFYSNILNKIAVIRESYADVEIVKKYDDNSLAMMMLLDASMVIDFMHKYIGMKGSNFCSWQRCLGISSLQLMVRDMVVMENQIPFRVLKMLLSLHYREEAALFVSRFVSKRTGIMELKHARIPRENEDPPIHLLEAFWRLMVRTNQGFEGEKRVSMREEMHNDSYIDIDIDGAASYTPRSVMDLKIKGIRVYCTRLATDITFRPDRCFGQLHIPFQTVSSLTLVVWSNMIAFEILPDSPSRPILLSYALFMKSLIQTTEDVKELQQKGVIFNKLANLEKVVEMYKDIDTFALDDQDVFKDVKRRIEEHCNSRTRTWIAELIYTQFRTSWTVIALFAAAVLLCLTFLQTFYTIRR